MQQERHLNLSDVCVCVSAGGQGMRKKSKHNDRKRPRKDIQSAHFNATHHILTGHRIDT